MDLRERDHTPHGGPQGLRTDVRSDGDDAVRTDVRRAMPAAAQAARRSWNTLFLLFFLSGLSGLIYESLWSRYIRQFVGSAATAQILVLALFMGGMSLGALIAGRSLRNIRRPVVAYGIIEGLIGLYALAFPSVHEAATRLCYDVIFPALGGGTAVSLTKWVVAGALVLPATTLLGMTFPLMSVGILRRDPQRSGEILSALYFTNSLGAALGALLSGFVLVAHIGLPGALAFGAALNLAIAVVAVRDREAVAPLDHGVAAEDAPTMSSGLVLLFLCTAFGTGLSSFMYEIGWIRLLSMILGSATHSFEVMLSAFIFGMALGGFWVRKRLDKFRRPELVLGIVQLVMGLSAIATLPAYRVAVELMGGLLAGDERTYGLWIAFNVVRYLLCLLIMLPATFCAGMTLPLLTHVMLRRGRPEGEVGRVYGVNTLGAIAGAVLAGIVLMPVIGLKNVIVAGAVIDMVLGLVLVKIATDTATGAAGESRLLRTSLVGALATTAIGLFVIKVDPMVLTATVFRHGRTRLPDDYEIKLYVDGRTASVTLLENTPIPGHFIIYTNGKPDASVKSVRWPEGRRKEQGPQIAGDEPNQFLVGLLPYMVRPNATHGALIGFGSGVTCHTVLGSPTLERLDTIEIEANMVRGAKLMGGVNERAYSDPRNHIWYDDAKAYFAAAATTYDFIISEPTNPWVSGVSSLFTVEFYREAKRYLKPGGVMAQWLQGYELGDPLLLTVLAALDDEFSDYLIVRVGERDWMILAVAEGTIGPLSAEPLAWDGMAETLELLGVRDIGQLDGLIVANRKMLHPYVGELQPNTDAFPILDTRAEHARFLRLSAELLHGIRFTPAPLLQVLGGIERRDYPLAGIGDLREAHVMIETEQAATSMRRLGDPGAPLPEGQSAERVDRWRTQEKRAAAGEADWVAWLNATYDLYREVGPHLAVHRTPWWPQVLARARSEAAPAEVRETIELLDALDRREGERLWAAVQALLDARDYQIPPRMVRIAGVVALELRDAPRAERVAFAEAHMADAIGDETSEGRAYAALRAYALR
jgi:predicted membrane-bound spermidine synthase